MRSIFLLGCCLSLGLLTCENDLAEIEALRDQLDVKTERIEGVDILYSDSARVKVRITGPVMLNHLDRTEPYQEFIDGVRVDFFDDDQNITSTMTANYAIRYDRRGEVIVRDSVFWRSIDGQRLETEELIWREKTGKIFTKKFAKIETRTETIYGHGFEADQDFTNARIQQVEGIVTVDDQ